MTIFHLDNQGRREGTSSVLIMNCEKKIRKKILNHNKYITNNDFNKFSGAIFHERSKQAKLAAIDLKNVEQYAIRNEEKTKTLQTFYLSFFVCKNFIGYDGLKTYLCISQHLIR